jgi:hypothetical protein
MTNQEIIYFYDSNISLTLAQLSGITGKTIPQLKKILLN